MKKLFLVLVSVLLLTGVAYAVDLDQSVTAEFASQNTGRSVVTDESVILRIWYTGSLNNNASVGVSGDTIELYAAGTAAYTVLTTDTSYDTPGEIVGYINNQTDWHASVGPDSYADYSVSGAIIASDNVYISNTAATGASIYDDSSTSTKMLVGVEKDDTATIRVKGINQQFYPTVGNGTITIDVYDGNTRIYRRVANAGAQNSTTLATSSANTVALVPNDSKGLAATKGNSLCVVVDTNSVDVSTGAKALNQLSITYDKLRN